MSKHTINAQGKRLGRVASEAASLLMGKNDPSFQKNKVAGVSVEIQNAGKLLIEKKKMKDKIYTRYTGYPGGLRTESMEYVLRKKGYGEALRRAVYGMLPGNKLRKERMKCLIIKG